MQTIPRIVFTLLLLEHLLEIENRGLHLERGFYNLHNLLVAEFKYSDSEAATRLQAMKLLKKYSEVKEKMSDGQISLCQAADINRFLVVEKKNEQTEVNSNAPLALTEKRDISIENIIKNKTTLTFRGQLSMRIRGATHWQAM